MVVYPYLLVLLSAREELLKVEETRQTTAGKDDFKYFYSYRSIMGPAIRETFCTCTSQDLIIFCKHSVERMIPSEPSKAQLWYEKTVSAGVSCGVGR